MTFYSSSSEKHLQVSDDQLYSFLKRYEKFIKEQSDKTYSNGYFVVAQKDYGKHVPFKALLFTLYAVDVLAQDMEILKVFNWNDEKFMDAYQRCQDRKRILIQIFPYVKATTLNAFFSPANGGELHFHVFEYEGQLLYTCENYDTVVHETSHANFYILRPDISSSRSTQTNAFEEAWADLSAIFSLLMIPEVREKYLKLTKGDLLLSTFISMLAEPLNKGHELRNAINEKTMKNVKDEAHDQSNVFTAAIYGVLAEAFRLFREKEGKEITNDQILQRVVKDLRLLLLEAFILVRYSNPLFADIGRKMRAIAKERKHLKYLLEPIKRIFKTKEIDVYEHHDDQRSSRLPTGSSKSFCCKISAHLLQTQKASIPLKKDKEHLSGLQKISSKGFIFKDDIYDAKEKPKKKYEY